MLNHKSRIARFRGKCGRLLHNGSAEPALWLKPKMTGWMIGLKWQCIAYCYLFKFMTNVRCFIVITSTVAIKFENLGDQLLHHCRQTDRRYDTSCLDVVAFVPQTMNTIDCELQPSNTRGSRSARYASIFDFPAPHPPDVYSVSQKVAPAVKPFAIFSLRPSLFLWNFANLLPVCIHCCLPLSVDLS